MEFGNKASYDPLFSLRGIIEKAGVRGLVMDLRDIPQSDRASIAVSTYAILHFRNGLELRYVGEGETVPENRDADWDPKEMREGHYARWLDPDIETAIQYLEHKLAE